MMITFLSWAENGWSWNPGDGDQDLILGASTSLMAVEDMVGQLLQWQTAGGAVIILENKLK